MGAPVPWTFMHRVTGSTSVEMADTWHVAKRMAMISLGGSSDEVDTPDFFLWKERSRFLSVLASRVPQVVVEVAYRKPVPIRTVHKPISSK